MSSYMVIKHEHLLVFREIMSFRDTVQKLFNWVTTEDVTLKWICSTGPSVPVSWWIYLLGLCDIKMKLQWSNKSRCWSETISWWKENDLPTIFMILIISVFQFWIMTVFLLSESCFCANNISEIPQRSSLHMLIYLHQYILIKSMRSLQNSEECQWGVPRDVSCTIQSNV